jgi:branched-chain amino acid transport system substrate-binding protein
MRRAMAGAIVCGVMGGCAGEDAGEPVKVGLLSPSSGALEFVGQSFERIAAVAVESINDFGGIDGRDLELIILDTETNAELAAPRLEALIDQGVVAVVGPGTSGEATNAYPVARDRKVPIISPSSTAPALSSPEIDDGGFLFRNVPDDDIQGIAIAYYLLQARAPSVASVAVLFEDTPYGIGLKEAFKGAYLELGGTVAGEVDFAQNLTADDADAAITELAALGEAPAMTVLIALEQDAVKLVGAWDGGGAAVIPGMQFFMTDGARSSGFLDGAPASVYGMCGTAPTFPVTGLAYGTLKSDYEEAHPDVLEDQVFAPNVWDGYHLIAAALVEQANEFPDEALGGDHLRDAINDVSRGGQIMRADQWRDLISAIRDGNDVDYDGAAGPNDFDENGQAVGPYEVWCISDDGSTFDQALFLDAAEIQALLGT